MTHIFFLLLLKIMTKILKFTDTPIIDVETYEYTYTTLLLAPVLITAVISELVLNSKTYSRMLDRAT